MKASVVTGMGAVSPAGFTLQDFWDTLAGGRTVYGPLPALAGDAPDMNPAEVVPGTEKLPVISSWPPMGWHVMTIP